MIIGIDHGYYAIKTAHYSFSAGVSEYNHEAFTKQGVLEYGGKYFVCGTGRQPIPRSRSRIQPIKLRLHSFSWEFLAWVLLAKSKIWTTLQKHKHKTTTC